MWNFPRPSSPGNAQVIGTPPRDIPSAADNSPSPRVLIVDDEPLIRWSLSEILAERGWQVAEAGDRDATLRTLASERAFDVVLLDFRLPDSNDLGLLQALRRSAPDTQVILMTAFGTAEVRQGALGLGAFTVVDKPFEIQQIAALVSRAHAARPS
jgi:DNA-binding NtrC family response regulator